jgi:uncharacterized protein (TIGR02246 family)
MTQLSRWVLAGVLAGALLAQGCAKSKAEIAEMDMPADTRAADEAAIRAASAAWSAATEAKDVEKSMSFYTPDAVGFDDGGPMETNQTQFRDGMQKLVDAKDTTIAWKTTKVEVAKSGDMAYEYGAYHLDTKQKNGTVETQHGKYLLIWKKQADDNWKVAIDTDNSDSPRAH